MNHIEELRNQVLADFEADIRANYDCGFDQVATSMVTAKRIVELLKRLEVPVDAVWQYYTNDEGKARWRCTNCGKLCRRNPYNKLYCSTCGSRNNLET